MAMSAFRQPAIPRWLAPSLFVLCALCNHAIAQQPTTATLARDVYYLASDELEGRGDGSNGLEVAGDYIAARFKTIGLRPLPGTEGYFQPFTMNAPVSVGPRTTLQIGQEPLIQSRQYRPLGFSADGDFSSPVVFAGYGITSADPPYDDYAGADVKGKTVLIMRYEPHNDAGQSKLGDGEWTPAATFNSKARLAAEHGAKAILVVNPPKYHGDDQLMGIATSGGSSTIPILHITQDVANNLLKRGGSTRTLEQLQTEIDATLKPQSIELNGLTVSGTVSIQRSKVQVRNVMAYLPGTNADEFVVVGGHYDHLGHGGAGSMARGSDDIHNGADDNASGTAAVLALAQELAAGDPPRRSILFVLFAGEEHGLLGSQYFVDHPPVPLDHIVAMLNLDMVGRVRNEVLYTGGSGTAAGFARILSEADSASPLELKSIGSGGRGPSDHQSFALKRIPVIFLFSGLHADYHRPTDDADKINYDGLAQVVDFSRNLVDAFAAMPRQRYVSTFDSRPVALAGTGSKGARVALGVYPDYGTDESTQGVRITGTTRKSPADLAGLKAGDIIVRIGDRAVENLYDLTGFLADREPGEQIRIIIQRDNLRIELTATLTQAPG